VELGSFRKLFALVGWFQESDVACRGRSGMCVRCGRERPREELTRGTRWISSLSKDILEIISNAAVPVL
jgi:hypothetical protein